MSTYGHFSQLARKGYINYFPSAVRQEFTGGKFPVEIELADIFEKQRHLLRIDQSTALSEEEWMKRNLKVFGL